MCFGATGAKIASLTSLLSGLRPTPDLSSIHHVVTKPWLSDQVRCKAGGEPPPPSCAASRAASGLAELGLSCATVPHGRNRGSGEGTSFSVPKSVHRDFSIPSLAPTATWSDHSHLVILASVSEGRRRSAGIGTQPECMHARTALMKTRFRPAVGQRTDSSCPSGFRHLGRPPPTRSRHWLVGWP